MALGVVVLVFFMMVLVGGGVVLFALRGTGAGGGSFAPGTRAFEAHLTLGPLGAAIDEARRELAASASRPEKRGRLERELRFLEDQKVELEAIVARGDTSPGKGYVGFTRLPAGD